MLFYLQNNVNIICYFQPSTTNQQLTFLNRFKMINKRPSHLASSLNFLAKKSEPVHQVRKMLKL